jgi:hypothetical protein
MSFPTYENSTKYDIEKKEDFSKKRLSNLVEVLLKHTRNEDEDLFGINTTTQ